MSEPARAREYQGHSEWRRMTARELQVLQAFGRRQELVLRERLCLMKLLMPWAGGTVSETILGGKHHTNLGHHTHDEAFLLDVVRFYRVAILQDLAYIAGSATAAAMSQTLKEPRRVHTGVDQLLLRDLPSFIRLDLGLQFTNLSIVSPETM